MKHVFGKNGFSFGGIGTKNFSESVPTTPQQKEEYGGIPINTYAVLIEL